MQTALVLFAFNLGIVLTGYIPELPSKEALVLLVSIAALVPIILILSGALRPRPQGRLPTPARLLIWSIIALICGGIWAAVWGTMQLRQSLPQAWEKKDFDAVGYVAGLPQDFGKRIRFPFAIKEITAPDGSRFPSPNNPLPFRKAQLSWYDPPPSARLLPGQKLQLKIRVRKPYSLMNPGGFDYEAYMLQQRISAQGYLRRPPVILATTGRYPIARWRAAISRKIAEQDISPQARGLLGALTIGDRSEISADDRLTLQRNGISHLIAISGLHLSMVGSSVFFAMVFLFGLPGRLRRMPGMSAGYSPLMLGACFTLPLVWLYALLAGFSLPTQRALLMLSVFLFAFIGGRFYRLLTVYAAAMTLVLVVNPLAAFGAGFWLSFMAAGIILLTAKRLVGNRVGLAGFLRSMLLLQGLLLFCLAPFILFFFYELSLVGLFVNLIAIPLTGFVLMPAIFLITSLLFILPALGEWLLVFVSGLIDICYVGLEFFAGLPQSYVRLPQPSISAMVFAIVGIIFWLCRRSRKDALTAIAFFLPLFFPADSAPASDRLRVSLLDVGQGLAVHLRTKNHHMLFDTGSSFSPHSSAGSLVIVPYLKHLGADALDMVMVSHRDKDHSGGLTHVLRDTNALAPERLMLNFPVPAPRPPVSPCVAGQSWRWDGVLFETLHPPADYASKNRNDLSCVLLVTAANHTLLLTGDITVKVEGAVLAKLGEKSSDRHSIKNTDITNKIDVLQVPHHGSKDASGNDFVRAVRPAYAVFAAGYKNPYRHPHSKVVQRYLSVGATPVILWQTGMAAFELGGEKITYNKGYRLINKRYWHRTENQLNQ